MGLVNLNVVGWVEIVRIELGSIESEFRSGGLEFLNVRLLRECRGFWDVR